MRTPNQLFIALWEKALRDDKGYRYIAENTGQTITAVQKMAWEYRRRGLISGSLKTYRSERQIDKENRAKFVKIWKWGIRYKKSLEQVAHKLGKTVSAALQYRKQLAKRGVELAKLDSELKRNRTHRADLQRFINTWMECHLADKSYAELRAMLGISRNTMKCTKYRIQSLFNIKLPKLARS